MQKLLKSEVIFLCCLLSSLPVQTLTGLEGTVRFFSSLLLRLQAATATATATATTTAATAYLIS